MRTEDGYIIYKCLNGDSSAFGFLVDKYKAGVYAVAYERLHNFHDAEDQDQDMLDAPSGDIYHQELACESVREALDSLPESHRQILTSRHAVPPTS